MAAGAHTFDEELLRTTVDVARIGICFIGPEGQFVYVNPAFCELSGFAAGELIGRHWTLAAPPALAGEHERFYQALLADSPRVPLEWKIRRKDGTLFDALVSWKALDGRDGRRYVVVTFSDITERTRALQKSEERYRQVVENAYEGIVVTQEGFVKFANARAAELAGRSLAETYTTPFPEMIHPDDRQRVYQNYLKRMRGEPTENHYDFRVLTPAGEARWVTISAIAIEWEGRPATLNFFTDATDRKRAEEDMQRALQKERELSELKTSFVALASHEFKSPIATILSSVELLEDFGERLPAAQRGEVIGLVKGALKRMTEMLDQVLLIGRAETQGLVFQPRPLDARMLCEEVIAEARRAAHSAPIEFLQRGNAGRRLLDDKLLRHALGNLLSNALKYSRGGRVALELDAEGAGLRFRVSDEGIGIPEEDRARLFTTFHRGANALEVEGTGLGLAIVKHCVERHGGTVAVESELGRGTTFTVSVPAPAAA
jgi:PAS domain S-box-containing protein